MTFKGTADSFLKTQLKPENFSAAAAKAGYPVEVMFWAKTVVVFHVTPGKVDD